jgi:hypothetical protein
VKNSFRMHEFHSHQVGSGTATSIPSYF